MGINVDGVINDILKESYLDAKTVEVIRNALDQANEETKGNENIIKAINEVKDEIKQRPKTKMEMARENRIIGKK
ncbi:hypothetical protein [Virgibacillus pantothenticus]|uniref:hypothetical protein n=1 Tax=Virgibacillus pantothenticus TaxID=1473 RepID=UPI0025AF2DBD|nr:hypothetical protein [Virgibacillus pantothenticus]